MSNIMHALWPRTSADSQAQALQEFSARRMRQAAWLVLALTLTGALLKHAVASIDFGALGSGMLTGLWAAVVRGEVFVMNNHLHLGIVAALALAWVVTNVRACNIVYMLLQRQHIGQSELNEARAAARAPRFLCKAGFGWALACLVWTMATHSSKLPQA